MNAHDHLSPVPSFTRRDFVEDALRTAILSGQLPPGTQIVEAKLAERFRVSRGPLREAIRTLAEEGLLVVRPYTGTYVASVTEEDLVEIHVVRLGLELQAFRLCWPKRDAEYRQELLAKRDALTRASESGHLHEEIGAELALHSVPFAFSGNRLLQEFWRQLSQKIQLGFLVYRKGTRAWSEDPHDCYVNAALGDSLEACLTELERHVNDGIEIVHAYFREAKRRERVTSPRVRTSRTQREILPG